MKKITFTLVGLVLFFAVACSNDDNLPSQPETETCWQLIAPEPTDQLVADSVQVVVDSLLAKNNISTKNLQVYQVSQQSTNTQVKAYQYSNGQRVFLADMIYNFDASGTRTLASGIRIDTIEIPVMPNPRFMEDYLIAVYFSQLQNDGELFDQVEEIKNGCLDFQFGFLALKNTQGDMVYVRGWKITPRGKDFPKLILNDETGRAVFYDNGIVD